MIVKMTILRLLGSSDDKEKIGVARPEMQHLRWFRKTLNLNTKSLRMVILTILTITSSVQRTRIEETVKKSKSKRSKRRQFAITG